MSLPPGFLDELRNRTSIAQVVGRKVMWDTRKSNQGKGDMWSPCPFHHEKTASFHVDDKKGYYYCFGCHAKGDALGFVKDTENVSFMEAVEILAREAGMPMPARDPKAQEKADRRTQLAEVMEVATSFFKLQLKTSAGSDAREYLNKRRMKQSTLDTFEIGFAPDGWQGLWDHLTSKNISEELIIACGLAKESQKGKKPYDTFRNRIMFPIRDPRGRCIGFGGRAMDPNDNAKYLNSPETELFDKGRSLYNHGPAREAAGKGHPLIVAEGYMDVIALAEAGFGAAVAPLGTAVTETQLQLLWRISDEPIIALDGDKAGVRAAERVVDLALPLLEAGKALRFAVMPEGQDPDDLIKAGGAGAMQGVLDNAMAMVQLLWDRETLGKSFDSPERKAGLDKVLRDRIKLIKDPSIRAHYGQAIKDLRWALFRPKPQPRKSGMGGGKWNKAPAPAQASTKNSALAQTSETSREIRESAILCALLKTPELVEQYEYDLERMASKQYSHQALAGVLIAHCANPTEIWDQAVQRIGEYDLDMMFQQPHIRIAPALKPTADLDFIETCLKQEFAKLFAMDAHTREIAEAEQDLQHDANEGLTWRLAQSAQSLQDADRGEVEDKTQFATADNGAKISLDERNSLNALLDQIQFAKPKR